MEYKHISQDEQDEIIAEAIRSREREHFHYELNKQNYAHILTQIEAEGLPEVWPSSIAKFRTLGQQQMVDVLTGDDLLLAQKLSYRDKVRKLVSTEASEQRKCESALNALKVKLPDEAKVSAALARIAAKKES